MVPLIMLPIRSQTQTRPPVTGKQRPVSASAMVTDATVELCQLQIPQLSPIRLITIVDVF